MFGGFSTVLSMFLGDLGGFLEMFFLFFLLRFFLRFRCCFVFDGFFLKFSVCRLVFNGERNPEMPQGAGC